MSSTGFSLPTGFSRQELEEVATDLETNFEGKIPIGNVTGIGEESVETAPAVAARFIRAALSTAG